MKTQKTVLILLTALAVAASGCISSLTGGSGSKSPEEQLKNDMKKQVDELENETAKLLNCQNMDIEISIGTPDLTVIRNLGRSEVESVVVRWYYESSPTVEKTVSKGLMPGEIIEVRTNRSGEQLSRIEAVPKKCQQAKATYTP